MSYIISVGAGKNQFPLIKRLCQKDHKVVAFDINNHAPAKEYCYFFNSISTWDYKEAIQWLHSLKLTYSGVGCFSYGNALITQHKIARAFNLPGAVKEETLRLNNKLSLREVLTKHQLSSIEEYVVPSVDLKNIKLKSNKYIIKPVDGVSSRDIRVQAAQEINEFFTQVREDSPVIIQEFINGDEYRIATIIQDRKIKFFALLSKVNLKKTNFTGRLAPTKEKKWAKNLLGELIDKFSIENAVMKIDCIKANDRIEIIEIDFGIAGDYFETFSAPLWYGYNYIDHYIEFILGNPLPDFNSEVLTVKCFDYIYNIGKNPYKIDYKVIEEKLCEEFMDFQIIKTRKDGENGLYPQSNLDALFGLLHNKYYLPHEKINRQMNQLLKG